MMRPFRYAVALALMGCVGLGGCSTSTDTPANAAAADSAARAAVTANAAGDADLLAHRGSARHRMDADQISPDPLGEPNLLQQEVQVLRVRRQAVLAEFDALMDLAQRQLAECNISGARDSVSQARYLVNRHQRYLSSADQHRLNERARTMSARVEQTAA